MVILFKNLQIINLLLLAGASRWKFENRAGFKWAHPSLKMYLPLLMNVSISRIRCSAPASRRGAPRTSPNPLWLPTGRRCGSEFANPTHQLCGRFGPEATVCVCVCMCALGIWLMRARSHFVISPPRSVFPWRILKAARTELKRNLRRLNPKRVYVCQI